MSSIYTVSKLDIITEALELVGVLEEGEEPLDHDITSVGRSLSMLIKAWQTDGIHIWAVDNLEIPLTAGDNTYTIGPDKDIDVPYRPVRVVHGVHRDENDNDIPLNIWSREEYWRLSRKDSQGIPLNIYFDRRVDYGVLYVWQTPVSDTKLILQIQRGLEFPQDNNTDIDFPGEYFLAVAFNLALIISPKYSVPQWMQRSIAEQARMYKMDAEGYNREDETSLFLEPDFRGGHRGYS